MAIKLREKLEAMKLTSFTFSTFEKKVSSATDGQTGERNIYLVFHLDDLIPTVTGTNSLYDPDTNARQHYVQTDVATISCNLNVIEKYEEEFTFAEDVAGKLTGSGKYEGDLFLDIAKSGDVWLTDVKFSKLSGDFKRQKRSEEFSNMVKKLTTAKAS